MLDHAIGPAHDVALERCQRRLAVAFEGQSSRLVKTVYHRLAEPATERSTHEPLQLDASCRPHGEEVRQARVGVVGERPHTLEL